MIYMDHFLDACRRDVRVLLNIGRLTIPAENIRTAIALLEWRPLASAPRNGTYVELRGDSGHTGHLYRVMIGRYDREREAPKRAEETEYGDPWAWRTVAGDHVTNDGEMPTHWRPVS